MTDYSPRLGAPLLAPGQATPETTTNEQMATAEQGASRFVVVDRDLSAAPGSPAQGACYLVAGTPGGADAWFGHGGDLAFYFNTGWKFIEVLDGFAIEVLDEDKTLVRRGVTWVEMLTTGSGGVQSMPVLAASMTPRTTSGPASGSTESATNKVMARTLDFDQAADEFAQFMFPMPKSWNEGTVTAQFLWKADSGTAAQSVVWAIQAVALSDDDAIDAAFGTAQSVTDAVTALGDLMQSAFTSALTIAGTPAEGDLVVFQVFRDADNVADTLAADARLIGIRLNFTTNAQDDS
jgi:hypothetical protein